MNSAEGTVQNQITAVRLGNDGALRRRNPWVVAGSPVCLRWSRVDKQRSCRYQAGWGDSTTTPDLERGFVNRRLTPRAWLRGSELCHPADGKALPTAQGLR